MPASINPTSRAESKAMIAGSEAYLRHYAAKVLQEAPITSPAVGYKAYDKRIAFAERCIQAPEKEAQAAAFLFSKCDSNLEQDAQANGISIFYFLTGATQGFELADADASLINQWSNVGTTSGKSVWDALSEVNQSDLI